MRPTLAQLLLLAIAITLAFSQPSHADAGGAASLPQSRRTAAVDVSYIRAALRASDTRDENQLQRTQHLFEAHAGKLRASCGNVRDDAMRAQCVHEYLHGNVLRHYRPQADDLARALETGEYNCVTAAILWAALADQVGLCVDGIEESAHVLCLVRTSDGALLFEPTLVRWSPVRTSIQLDPDTSAGVARVVTRWQLLALLHYNRAIKLAAQHDYAGAVAGDVAALWHDPSHREARHNLLAAANDWALLLARQERWIEAYTVLWATRRFSPGVVPLEQNAAYLQRRLVKVTIERLAPLISGGILTAGGF